MAKKRARGTGKPGAGTTTPLEKTPSPLATNQLFHLSLILLAGVLAYCGTLSVPFVFDDHASIVDNPLIKDLANLAGTEGLRLVPRRFVGYLTFALNYRFGGLHVTGFHLVNLAIHLCTAVSYYFFVRITFNTPRLRETSWQSKGTAIALASALLFVLHPIQTQAVTYIVQRFASLATLFYLLAMLCYAAGRIRQVKEGMATPAALVLFGATALAGMLALMTKEIAFTLPYAILLYECVFFHNSRRKAVTAAAAAGAGIVAFAIFAISTDQSIGSLLADVSASLTETRNISREDYLLTQFRVIVTYVRLIFIPVGQNLDYDYPLYHSLFQAPVLLSLLFVLVLMGSGIRFLTKAQKDADPLLRLTAFGIFWFFLTLSVESSIIPISDLVFEHRLYLPSIGAFIAIISVGVLAFRKLPAAAPAAVLAIVALLLGILTWQRNAVWQDAATLWEDAVAKSPRKARTHNELGKVLFDKKLYPEAIAQYRTAISLAPQFLPPHTNLGAAYMKSGNIAAAIEEYRKALLLAPEQPETHNNLGTAYDRQDLLNEAVAEFQQAVRVKPDYAAAHNNLGAVLRKKGRFVEAKAEYETALRLKPEYSSPYNNLGILSAVQGKLDEAAGFFETAIRLQPDNAEFRENLAKVYEMKGLHDRAESERKKIRGGQ